MPTGRVCFDCKEVYFPDSGGSNYRCRRCERERSAKRVQYRGSEYRKAQAVARSFRGRLCPKCGKRMVGKNKPSVDHVVPVSRGGSKDGPYQIICLVCNISKHNN